MKNEFDISKVESWEQLPPIWKVVNKVPKKAFKISPNDKEFVKIMEITADSGKLYTNRAGVFFDEKNVTTTDGHRLFTIPNTSEYRGLYSDGKLLDEKFPDTQYVIESSIKDSKFKYNVSLYKIKTYCEALLNGRYCNQTTFQVRLKYSESLIGVNVRLLLDILKQFSLSTGTDELFVSISSPNKAILFSINNDIEIGRDVIGLLMPVMLSSDNEVGAEDLDFEREAGFIYDLSKDEIINKDGSIAYFSYDTPKEYIGLTDWQYKLVKRLIPKKSNLPIEQYLCVINNSLFIHDISKDYELQIKNINIEDGIYYLVNDSLVLSKDYSVEEFPQYKLKGKKDVDIIVNRDEFLYNINIASEFVSNDETRQSMMGVYIGKNDFNEFVLASTDGHKLYNKNVHYEGNFDEKKNNFIVSNISFLKSFLDNTFCDEIQIESYTNSYFTKFVCGDIIFTCKDIYERFPDFKNAIPSKEYYEKGKKLKVKLSDLRSCIKTLKKDDFLYITKTGEVIDKNEKTLCSIDILPSFVEFNDSILVMPALSSKNIQKFEFEISFVKENIDSVLSVLKTDYVNIIFNEKNRAVLLVEENKAGDFSTYKETKKQTKETKPKEVINSENVKIEKEQDIDKKGQKGLYEFFTPEFICSKMWDLAYMYGFNDKGKVLEPSIGSGNLVVDAPNYSNITAFEIKKEYYEMAKSRLIGATIYNQSFETAFLQEPRYSQLMKGGKSWLGNNFDLVISNPPYGEATGFYKSIVKMSGQIEHWFILNTVKLLKSGGLGIYIIPSNFMRNGNQYNNIKKEIFDICDLLDVYRLPNGSFKTTQIGTDIIVLKKK